MVLFLLAVFVRLFIYLFVCVCVLIHRRKQGFTITPYIVKVNKEKKKRCNKTDQKK